MSEFNVGDIVWVYTSGKDVLPEDRVRSKIVRVGDDSYRVEFTESFTSSRGTVWQSGDKFSVSSFYLELVQKSPAYTYEVTAGTFRRTYEDEGKAIAVARAVRDYISSMIDPDNHPNVTLIKTPTVLTPEKVEF